MTTLVSITNMALQKIGTRTTVASMSEQSNEAIQSNLMITDLRDQLLRMAPWNCATNFNNLVYITSAPGTPENPNQGTSNWEKGIPAPPWAYEYQYPVDCLRPLWVVPQFQTGFSGGIPITTAVTGGVPSFWNGPPVRFKVSIDQFFGATSLIVASGGSDYVVNEVITLATPSSGLGAPAKVLVTTVGGGGNITAASLVSNVIGETVSGSYFTSPTNPVAQGSSTGNGTGATFNLTMQSTQADQRVILTNQENATVCYIKQVTDPNIMDSLFLHAWSSVLASRLAIALTGDKQLANLKLGEANHAIMEARCADGNEGLTINDVTPDFIRVRGIQYPVWEYSPNMQYDWGPLFTPY